MQIGDKVVIYYDGIDELLTSSIESTIGEIIEKAEYNYDNGHNGNKRTSEYFKARAKNGKLYDNCFMGTAHFITVPDFIKKLESTVKNINNTMQFLKDYI